MRNTILVVDGNHLARRVFYAMPNIKTSTGEHTGTLFGFLRTMRKLAQLFQPRAMVSVFDGSITDLQKVMKHYKQNRSRPPQEYLQALKKLQRCLPSLGVRVIRDKNQEGDITVALCTAYFKKQFDRVVIVSSDKDFHQLIDENKVVVYDDVQQLMFTEELWKAKNPGLTPKDVIIIKSVTGCSSDNIFGIKGVGDKRALKVCKIFHSLKRSSFRCLRKEKYVKGLLS